MTKILSKRVFLLILFLVMIMTGIFLYENEEVRQEFFAYFKAIVAPELDLSQDTGLDLSGLNLEIGEKDEGLEDEELSSSQKEQQGKQRPERLTLEQIKEKLDQIEKKKNEIEKEINKLVALKEIEKKLDAVAQQAEILSEEISTLGCQH